MLHEYLPYLAPGELIFVCLKFVFEGIYSIDDLTGAMNNPGIALRLGSQLKTRSSPPTFGDDIGAGAGFRLAALLIHEAEWSALCDKVGGYKRNEVDSVPNVLDVRGAEAANDEHSRHQAQLREEKHKRGKRVTGMHNDWRAAGALLVGPGDGLEADHQEMRGLFNLIFTVVPRLGRRVIEEE